MKLRVKVAPFTGAWIETIPARRRVRLCAVAPFTGAWIETATAARRRACSTVAPFTGAWIETKISRVISAPCGGRRPLHGGVDRNLKTGGTVLWQHVAPFTGAWIETDRVADGPCDALVAPFAGAWIET